MATKLVNHALLTQNLQPQTTSEALLLLSVAGSDVALKFLQEDGKKWTSDIEGRRIYIDLLYDAEKFSLLREFCEDEIERGADDWKVVRGWIDGHIGVFRTDTYRSYILRILGLICSEGVHALLSKLDDKYSHRNFALGTIHLSAECSPDLIIEGLKSPREQCLRYFMHYHCKSACFGDLQTYVADLSKEDQAGFLRDINSISDEAAVHLSSIYSNSETSRESS